MGYQRITVWQKHNYPIIINSNVNINIIKNKIIRSDCTDNSVTTYYLILITVIVLHFFYYSVTVTLQVSTFNFSNLVLDYSELY